MSTILSSNDPNLLVIHNGNTVYNTAANPGGPTGPVGPTGPTGPTGPVVTPGVPVYSIPYPPSGQWQIPTSIPPDAPQSIRNLAQALQNWPIGGAIIEFVVPHDLPPFNQTHTGTLAITPLGGGGSGNLPSGDLRVEGARVLTFSSEMPSWSWSIENPGIATFNTNRGSRVSFFMDGGGQWTFLLSTPNRY